MVEDKPYAEEGYKLMGAAFEVHNVLGGGLHEEIYQQSLEIELTLRQIGFASKSELKVFYKNQQLKKRFIPDFVVEQAVVVEIKALSALVDEHRGQLMNYMRVSRKRVGYLINFGTLGKLEYERFVIRDV